MKHKRLQLVQILLTLITIQILQTTVALCGVTFSHEGGKYKSSFRLSLKSSNPNDDIYFTLDGQSPTTESHLYTEPIALNHDAESPNNNYRIQNTIDEEYFCPDDIQKAIVVRARTFDKSGNPTSDIATRSYFIEELGVSHTLPIISITTDNRNLFDDSVGIMTKGIFFDETQKESSGNYYQRGKSWERAINFEFYDNKLTLNQ